MFTEAATKLSTKIRGLGTHTLYVADGQVSCPRRGYDVEIDRCYGCRFFVDTQAESGATVIRCRRERGELLDSIDLYS